MGHVRKVPSKRQAVVDDDTKLNLLLALEENPITPARQLARDSNLNHKTVLKYLNMRKNAHIKCKLFKSYLKMIQIAQNPHWMRELHTQRPQKTNVWAGIIQDRIVGPFFFDDTLNGARYLRLLQHELMPERIREEIGKITPQMLHNVRDETYHKLGCCQQYGASEPHLDAKRACLCVESVLERLSARQLVVTRNWQTFHTEVVEKRELLVRLEQTMAESTKVNLTQSPDKIKIVVLMFKQDLF
ncbi:hypothetical protein NQ318_016812 [Aromia moschata]|uniref:Spectrin repeats metazoan domain-containing protein n=1 Tax=Aromia moschata TaxID=1265417 RepID=A0AAV8YVB1_9CUCU|nr:hypothetical protein NQ318_016812 [Aromia moschata]